MIDKLIECWEIKKPEIRKTISEKKDDIDSYEYLLSILIKFLGDYEGHKLSSKYFSRMDPKRVTTIDHGDYQGSLIFIIGEDGYQPSKYWSTFVDYGSCCACDTLESIQIDNNNKRQIDDYMSLCLHLVQKMKIISGEDYE